ncbi:MAG: precorrin-8X methylmutase [Mogibacterium sp.]|nr:precorrin-8X methylmutase [Mogibacterium sp.]
MIEHVLPGDIEKRSFEIIAEELASAGITLDPEQDPVIRRAIHTSADFDYARTLVFSHDAVRIARELIAGGADIVTDTNMALTGINKKRIAGFGGSVRCYMADEDVAGEAKERGITRASVSMEHAARDIIRSGRRTIFAIGNAPTALITLRNMHDEGIFTPDFIIGVPVGFVNVVEAKELIIETDIPHIVNRGRKGGSNVAAAIVNAMIYSIQR